MSEDQIDIGANYEKPVLDKVIARMSEVGVEYLGKDNGSHVFRGLANKRMADLFILPFPSQIPQDQQDSLYTEWTEEITKQLRARE